jgi:hypothetical protein
MMRGPLNLRIEFSGAHSKQRCKLKYETVPIRIVILSQYTLKLLEAESWADRTDSQYTFTSQPPFGSPAVTHLVLPRLLGF